MRLQPFCAAPPTTGGQERRSDAAFRAVRSDRTGHAERHTVLTCRPTDGPPSARARTPDRQRLARGLFEPDARNWRKFSVLRRCARRLKPASSGLQRILASPLPSASSATAGGIPGTIHAVSVISRRACRSSCGQHPGGRYCPARGWLSRPACRTAGAPDVAARADALVANFAGQWRGCDVRSVQQLRRVPNRQHFTSPSAPKGSSSASPKKTAMLNLLRADYVRRQAARYGIPNVYGSRFQRPVPEARRGIPGREHAARASRADVASAARKWVLRTYPAGAAHPQHSDAQSNCSGTSRDSAGGWRTTWASAQAMRDG